MAKEVTVLSIEGSFLRGVRLEERNGAFECADVESWPLAEEAPEAAAEASGAPEEGVLAAPPPDDAPVEVLFYGGFIELHGVETIVEAARRYQGPPVRWCT